MNRQLLTFIVLAQLGGTLGGCANIEVKTGCFQDADCFAGSVCIEGACVRPDEFECGNERLEPGELCDGDCPESCNDGLSCTVDTMVGTPDECSAICVSSEIIACVSDDGCCPASCTALQDSDCAECGNGQQEGGEECDKGTANADGSECTSECTLARCGDGFLYVGHEECDGGDADTANCDYDEGTGPQACTPPECGDGHANLQAGEECDGGTQDTAICNWGGGSPALACTLARCGDGHLNTLSGEVCDEGEQDTETCDYADGISPQACTTPSCGDAHPNTAAGEECDDGFVDTARCNSARSGFTACTVPRCGDFYRNAIAGEQCDNGPLDTADCNYASGQAGVACTTVTCGDDYVNAAGEEVCDLGAANSDDGECTTLCLPATCGDGFVYGGVEECDDGPADSFRCDYDDGDGPEACTARVCGDDYFNEEIELCEVGPGCLTCGLQAEGTEQALKPEGFPGPAISMDGDTMLVGPRVLYRDDTNTEQWNLVTELAVADPDPAPFGRGSFAVSGDTAIAGWYFRPGAAYIFHRDHGEENQWGEVVKLAPSDPGYSTNFGWGADVDGTTAAVVTQGSGHNGAVYVYERNEGGADNWGEVAVIRYVGSVSAVAISGDTMVVSPGGSEEVRYRNSGGPNHWGLVATLPNGVVYGGKNIAVQGDYAATSDDAAYGNLQGTVYLYGRNEGGVDNWGLITNVRASDAKDYDRLAFSLSLDGDVLVAGAPGDGRSFTPGVAYVFKKDEGGPDNWGEARKLLSSDGAPDDRFGWAVAVSGDSVAIGAPAHDHGSTGATYMFELTP